MKHLGERKVLPVSKRKRRKRESAKYAFGKNDFIYPQEAYMIFWIH